MSSIRITKERAEEINYDDFEEVVGEIVSITENAKSQEDITESLTLMRTAAEQSGLKTDFSQTLGRIRKIAESDAIDNPFLELQRNGYVIRARYSLDDFKFSEEPLLEVFTQPTPFKQKRALQYICDEAKRVGFTGFKALYNAYVADRRMQNERPSGDLPMHPTQFPGQPLELDSGDWLCDSTGVYRVTQNGFEYACHHPILPVERLTNIDTLEEKLRIAFMKGRHWRTIIVGKKDLFDASKILGLAAYGVAVTSKCSKVLSEYICDIETLNYEEIPQQDSIARLGYLSDGSFSPYMEGLIFDGDTSYGTIFKAITQHGDYNTWKQEAIKCRRESVTAQIMLAASFASVLIKKLGTLPFFVHLWGVESGTGKTVALMLAASVWGDPEIGQYPQTFNATQVGHEKTAAFLGNIPMCIDELQLSKDSHGRSKFDVYQLAQGVGRTRGNKAGGVDAAPTWALCVLTTGESPIVSESAGAGAVNRVIDIECRASEAVIRDGIGTSKIVKCNYGHAGRDFVEQLADKTERAQELYQQYFRELSQGSTTEKQAMAAALILTADVLADDLIFRTGQHLTTAQISEFLKSKASVSAGERGYSYMCDWVAMNANKFDRENKTGDIYGVIEGDYAYINQSVFRKACKDAGFDDRALISWLKTNGHILTRAKNNTRGKRINGVNVECIAMKMKECDIYEGDDYNSLL